jgi:hypothetical protein
VKRTLVLTLAAAAVAVMLPRLLSAQFGLLDDGQMLRFAVETRRDWATVYRSYQSTGRFFPGYLAWLSLVTAVVGSTPALLFLVNAGLFTAVAVWLAVIVRFRGGSDLQAAAAAMSFMVSGPAIAATYTACKQELPQLFWVTVSLVLIPSLGAVGRLRKLGVFSVVTAALLVANTTKETSIVMIPISIAWVMREWLAPDSAGSREQIAIRAWYCVASVFAGVAFLGLRAYLGGVPLAQGSYTQNYRLNWGQLQASGLNWLVYLTLNFTYMVPLLLVGSMMWMIRRRWQHALVSDAVIWMVCWMGVYLPWGWAVEYYLLPFTFGCTALAGVLFGESWRTARHERAAWLRQMATAGIVASVALWGASVSNALTQGAIQLALDGANHDLIHFMARAPQNSSLEVDLSSPNEYVYEIGVHLSDFEKRPDIKVEYFNPDAVREARNRPGTLKRYVASPQLTNQAAMLPRVPVEEWGARERSRNLARLLGDGAEPVLRTKRRVRLVAFNMHQPVCEFIEGTHGRGLCGQRGRLMDTRVLSFGWTVYELPRRDVGTQQAAEITRP